MKDMLGPHSFVMKSLHKCACSETGSVDVGWKGSPSPTSAAGFVRTCCTREITTMQKWKMLALCFVLIVHSQWKYLLNTKCFLFSAWFIALSAKAIYQCISMLSPCIEEQTGFKEEYYKKDGGPTVNTLLGSRSNYHKLVYVIDFKMTRQ